jgi:II/X family phage/plasmid replication protein
MIDKVDADAPMPRKLFDAAMAANTENYRHLWVKPKTQFGSFKLAVHTKTQRMSWEICPMKILVGHNLFGTNNLDRIIDGILRAIYRRFGLTFTDKDADYYAEHGVLLSRIDLTGGFYVGYQPKVVETMELLRDHLLDHGYEIVVHEGRCGIESLYVGKKSSRSSVKFYNKYLEMLNNKGLQKLPYYNELLEYAKTVVRIEFTARTPELVRRGLQNSKDWTVSKVREILPEILVKLGLSTQLLAELPEDEVNQLSDAASAKYKTWLLGNDLKDIYANHTFKRDRTAFLKKGIDIGRTHANAEDAVSLSERLSVERLRVTWPKRFESLGAVYR